MHSLRLTLRTLLAYLDDTLDPGEIKSIGDKVADSTTAQETIARVKKLVRKRRLTTPPFTGPGAKFDANTIAEYLDNALESDAVTELEQYCLEKDPTADLYLAEIASCHQILTLVLGEPLMVPTTAKQRMVALVQGREAIPYRKPSTTTNTPKLSGGSHADIDLDEGSQLLGLSPRKSPWLAWAVPAIAAILLVGAGLALYFALPQLTEEPHKPANPNQVVAGDPNKNPRDKDLELTKDKDKDASVKDKDGLTKDKDGLTKDKDASVKDKDGGLPKDKDRDGPLVKDKDASVKDKDGGQPKDNMKDPIKDPHPTLVGRPEEPSTVRSDVGTYTFDPKSPTVLLQKQDNVWKRLSIGAHVSSVDPLVALPGYACSVKTDKGDKGVNLLLRGFVPQFATPGIEVTTRLLDCSVTLYQNSKVDADLTLHRGRLYISNGANPATVIVRFWKEAWVVRLTAPNSEVGFDLVTRYTPAINYLDGEEPLAELYFVLLKGKADLLVDTFEFPNLSAPPGPSFYAWTNKGQRMLGPVNLPEIPPAWNKEPPAGMAVNGMNLALKELAMVLVPPKAVNIVLKEGLSNTSMPARLLSIYALSAIDQVGDLLDQLGDEDPNHVLERDEATYALRRWISRDAKHNMALYNVKTQTGILIDKRYMQAEAETLLTLLHGLSNPREKGADDPKSKLGLLINNMSSSRVAIRHVAHYLLDALTNSIPKRPTFNAAEPPELREAAVKKFREMLESGALTPPATRPGGGVPIPPKP
jgi:hypothetical protein